MRVLLGIEDDPGQEELRSPHQRLLMDSGARRFARVETAASGESGHADEGAMSGALDVVSLGLATREEADGGDS